MLNHTLCLGDIVGCCSPTGEHDLNKLHEVHLLGCRDLVAAFQECIEINFPVAFSFNFGEDQVHICPGQRAAGAGPTKQPTVLRELGELATIHFISSTLSCSETAKRKEHIVEFIHHVRR
jgi:hypothetical protein